MLIQLIYLSKRQTSDEEIQKILEKSVEKNKRLNITGFLIYTNEFFLQCLEGDKENVMPLYETIKLDHRHKDIFLISYRMIQNRDFAQWAMGNKKINSQEIEIMQNFSDQEREIFNKILQGSEQNRAIEIIKKFAEKI